MFLIDFMFHFSVGLRLLERHLSAVVKQEAARPTNQIGATAGFDRKTEGTLFVINIVFLLKIATVPLAFQCLSQLTDCAFAN